MNEINPDVLRHVKDIVLLVLSLLAGFGLGCGVGSTPKQNEHDSL